MPILGDISTAVVQGLTSSAFPLELPPLPGASKIEITMRNIAGVARSPFTGSRQTFDWGGEYLLASVSLAPMRKELARAWVAFLALCRGVNGTFLLGDTSLPVPQGDLTGSVPSIVSSASNGRSIVIGGLAASKSGVLRSGDWIQIGTGATSRLYMNLLDLNSDASGQASAFIFPQLREVPRPNSQITVVNARGLFALQGNDRKFSVDNAMVYGIQFDAEEAI